MKYAIITPTFEPHFKYINKYLESYNRFVEDKNQIEIIFTISKQEDKPFQKIVKKYTNINYKVVYFEDLLNKYGIPYSSEELLNKYHKFTFQTLKKFYTMLDSDANYFLVLDSESMWINQTNMTKIFEQFIKAPFITCSNIENRALCGKLFTGIIENTNYLLNNPGKEWFLENFVWFYDKKILNDMFKELGTPIELANKILAAKSSNILKTPDIFEIQLYQNYILKNNLQYKYKVINADEILIKYLNEPNYTQYISDFYNIFKGQAGVLERATIVLNENNYTDIALMFKDNNFNIIRCDYTDMNNLIIQKKFLDKLQPNILAASQNHGFGVNNIKIKLLQNSKYYIKLKKHTKRFLEFLSYLIEPISIIIYAIKFIFYVPGFYKKYKDYLN